MNELVNFMAPTEREHDRDDFEDEGFVDVTRLLVGNLFKSI
jgi:hypothetical protein